MRFYTDNQDEQIGTSFPDDSGKQIDYVIKYREKKLDDNEVNDAEEENRKTYRETFFEYLEKEGFHVYYLKDEKDNHFDVYALLNCSLNRLLQEAENIKLQMKLKTVNLIRLNYLKSFI